MYNANHGFNSQPPEGGWASRHYFFQRRRLFQLTAARRRLVRSIHTKSRQKMFQLTAARRWLDKPSSLVWLNKGFNSQPPEGGWMPFRFITGLPPRFNSQPPEGGWTAYLLLQHIVYPRFNSQPPEGGWIVHSLVLVCFGTFQLTAARRRLVDLLEDEPVGFFVSTHSRPKAAGKQ